MFIGKDPLVRVSIGCSTYRPGEDTTSFLERADQAAYRANRLGRNRIESNAAESKQRA